MNILHFFTEAKDEVSKIVWPTREQTIRYTALVIIVTVAVGIILGGFDYLLTLLTAQFVK